MVRIRESFPDNESVAIMVDGVLDQEALPILDELCARHLKSDKKVSLHLSGLQRISREGMEYLRVIEERVVLVNPPEFMK